MPETDIECNSYNNKIGANNKLMKRNKDKKAKDLLTKLSMSKLFISIRFWDRLKMLITNKDSITRNIAKKSTKLFTLSKSKQKELNIINGPNRRKLN